MGQQVAIIWMIMVTLHEMVFCDILPIITLHKTTLHMSDHIYYDKVEN